MNKCKRNVQKLKPIDWGTSQTTKQLAQRPTPRTTIATTETSKATRHHGPSRSQVK